MLINEVLNKSSASSVSSSNLLEPISNRRPSLGLPLMGGLSISQHQNQNRRPSISSINSLDNLDTYFGEKCEKRPSISLSPLSLSPQDIIQKCNITANNDDDDIVGFTSLSRQQQLIGNAERRYSLPLKSVTRVLNRRNSISALSRLPHSPS
jgi:hypothetical protein